jgi:hypothetical protein
MECRKRSEETAIQGMGRSEQKESVVESYPFNGNVEMNKTAGDFSCVSA